MTFSGKDEWRLSRLDFKFDFEDIVAIIADEYRVDSNINYVKEFLIYRILLLYLRIVVTQKYFALV